MLKDQIFDEILGKEGGYVNNPLDKGGATRWGITEQVARAHGYTGDMQSLPRETALNILEADYWTGPRFDQISQVSPAIASELCDIGVNMGPTVGIKWLQRWLNAFNAQGTYYPDMSVDGAIGPRSVSALKTFLSKRAQDGEKVLLKAIVCTRGNRYLEITEARQANETFVYGWMANRVSL